MKAAGKRFKASGFTLIEIIAVLAILAILAAALTPALIKSIDQAVYSKESADLQSYANAFQRSIQRNRIIPGQDNPDPRLDWASAIGKEVGVNEWAIHTNIRYFNRCFVIDPAFPLPFVQTNGNVLTTNPVNPPRIMLISSVGQTNIPSLNNVNSNDFANIWNWDGFSPVPAAIRNRGWPGGIQDLVIQRVNLSGLFAHLLIFNYPSNNTWYSIDGQSALVPNAPSGTNIYVIKNTVLGLFAPDRTAFPEQIINQDATFVYDGAWRNSIYGSNWFTFQESAALNSSEISDRFLASRLNLNSGVTQSNVVNSIIGFMNAYYNYWASANEFTLGQYTAITSNQVMVNAMSSLINNPIPGNCR